MSNLPATQPTGGSVADIDAFVNAAMNAGQQLATAGQVFLKFSKGDWLLGKEQNGFPNNSFLFIPNLPDIRIGYQCWKDGTVVDEVWHTLAQGLPNKANLPEHGPYSQQGDGWSQASKLELVILPEAGVAQRIRALLTMNSKGGAGAIGKLLQAYGEALRNGRSPSEMPIVKATASSYRHAKFGKIGTPVFDIVEWRPYDAVRHFLEEGGTGTPLVRGGAKPTASATPPASAPAAAAPVAAPATTLGGAPTPPWAGNADAGPGPLPSAPQKRSVADLDNTTIQL